MHHYRFDEKRAFDPDLLAVELRQYNMDDCNTRLREIFDSNPICRIVYRTDFQSFCEDVFEAIKRLVSGTPQPGRRDPIIEAPPLAIPLRRNWPPNDSGYSLVRIFDAVTGQKRNFPQAVPLVSDLRFSPTPLRGLWGFCRYSDRSIVLSSVLNSPDIPLLVVEFMLYHELLHAAMPNSGHNKDFREQERRFTPSQEPIKDAEIRNMTVSLGQDGWRALADQFLDTFHRRFPIPSRADRMYY